MDPGLLQRLMLTMDYDGECWISRLAPSQKYAKVKVKGRNLAVHRVVYEMMVGPIPDGLTIDHLCRRTRCFNPKHLEVVTVNENIMRGDGIGVRNIRKTMCPQGHAYDRVSYLGRRTCGECARKHSRRYRAKYPDRARASTRKWRQRQKEQT